MRIQKKISAFTLTEMLVVLAITAIIAGLAFAIVTLFTKNMQSIVNNYNKGTKRSLFTDQLTVDFNRYNTIVYDPLDRALSFKNPLDSVIYLWEENWVIREKDTVLNLPTDLELYNSGEKLEAGNTDAIKIRFGEKEEDFIFIFRSKDSYSHIIENGD
ncbi:prepilin-type N-terminal cleavage/methylation domain-containing protein [Aequorivita sp. KMM 9714]|uniref:prepilin-type N-terminal cleavage/methylation domain-containing protein n=1 Tax=Aequorivita sp. KMM 9714 TaxID=2707173 RepID=UPI0013EB2687|nr:prepilin-type N-terminal cleavage/methylation domain-containing protein [Aequorivita sp. KMM 9714]NGX85377.1 type II secretion system protein [Aequorivita sp. KMM 9714]